MIPWEKLDRNVPDVGPELIAYLQKWKDIYNRFVDYVRQQNPGLYPDAADELPTTLYQAYNAKIDDGGIWRQIDSSIPSWRMVLDPANDQFTVDRSAAGTDPCSWTNMVLAGATGISVAVTDPIQNTGTAASPNIGLKHNTTNLRITSTRLNTIQDIHTGASPAFVALTLSGLPGTAGNFVSFSAGGVLQDSGSKAADFAAASHNQAATTITTDTANFDNNLSAADDTLQKALETLDELTSAPGGADTQVQYNDGGSFAGSGSLVYDEDTLTTKMRRFVVGGADTNSGTVDLSAKTISHWKCNDTSGTTVTDEYGNHTGTMQATINFSTTGVVNTAFDCNNTNYRYANCGTLSAAEWGGASGFAFSCWFKLTATPSNEYIAWASDGISSRIFFVGIPSAARINFGLDTSTGYTQFSADGATLTDGLWHHLICDYDGSNMHVYLDGSEYATAVAKTGTMTSETSTLLLFARNYYACFPGIVDDVRLFSDTLTEPERDFLYNGGAGTEDESGLAYVDTNVIGTSGFVPTRVNDPGSLEVENDFACGENFYADAVLADSEVRVAARHYIKTDIAEFNKDVADCDFAIWRYGNLGATGTDVVLYYDAGNVNVGLNLRPYATPGKYLQAYQEFHIYGSDSNRTGTLYLGGPGNSAQAYINGYYTGGLSYLTLAASGDITFDGDAIFESVANFEDNTYYLDNVKAIFGTGADVEYYYDGTDAHINTAAVAASDLVVSCGAGKTVKLDTAVWRDINLNAAVMSLPVATQPDEVQFVDETGVPAGIYSYGFAVGENVSGAFELQHDYKEGTDLYFHLHFQGVDAPTGTDKVKWQLTYTVAQNNATLDAATILTVEVDYDTQYEFVVAAFPVIAGTNFNIGNQFLFTIERIAATTDEYAGDAILSTVGVHYQVDTLGSRQMFIK